MGWWAGLRITVALIHSCEAQLLEGVCCGLRVTVALIHSGIGGSGILEAVDCG